MPGKPAVQVEGARELRRSLKRMGADAGELTETHRDAAGDVKGEAERRAPRRSGRLAGSGRVQASKARAGVTFGARLEYGAVIHFGWPGHAIEPQPFLYDALDARRDDVADRYARRIGELVDRLDRETR